VWALVRGQLLFTKIAISLRYFFFISYKGTNYHGWQIQPNANTVQAEINNALAIIFQQPIETVGSGRTDTGVHAKVQVLHADFDNSIDLESTMHKMNGIMPKDIVVNAIKEVTSDAHARFDAISRGYEYHLRFQKSPFGDNEYYFLNQIPDLNLMNEGSQILIGEHDFSSFSKVHTDVNHFNCTIFSAKWEQNSDGAVFYVTANRFLRGMVRAMVGTLLNLGQGKISMADFSNVLAEKNRARAGQSVPPQGLYLCEVRYPEHIFIK